MTARKKKNTVLFTFYGLYHIHLCERANQERQREALHSWFQSEGSFSFSLCILQAPYSLIRVGGWACCLGSESRSEMSLLSPPILYLATAMRAQPQPQPFLISTLAQLCIMADCGKPRYTLSLQPHGYMQVGLREQPAHGTPTHVCPRWFIFH